MSSLVVPYWAMGVTLLALGMLVPVQWAIGEDVQVHSHYLVNSSPHCQPSSLLPVDSLVMLFTVHTHTTDWSSLMTDRP